MISDDLRALADEPYVLLTTFRRTGEAVRTPVWIVGDGERLLVTTGAASGKVRRVGHTSRVELVPSGRRGEVAEGATVVIAEARVDAGPDVRERLDDALVAKYGDRYRQIREARVGPAQSTALVITSPEA